MYTPGPPDRNKYWLLLTAAQIRFSKYIYLPRIMPESYFMCRKRNLEPSGARSVSQIVVSGYQMGHQWAHLKHGKDSTWSLRAFWGLAGGITKAVIFYVQGPLMLLPRYISKGTPDAPNYFLNHIVQSGWLRPRFIVSRAVFSADHEYAVFKIYGLRSGIIHLNLLEYGSGVGNQKRVAFLKAIPRQTIYFGRTDK